MQKAAALATVVLACALWLQDTARSLNASSGRTDDEESHESVDGGASPPIVSASLSTDEIALALVPPSSLLAVSTFADDDAISNVTKLARRVPHRVGASTEALLSLQPHLVIADPFGHIGVERWARPLGVRVMRTGVARGFDDVAGHITAVGKALGAEDRARRLARDFLAEVRAHRAATEGRPPPRVLFYAGGFTAGRETVIDDVFRHAGARNVAGEAGVRGHAAFAVERVFAEDPDVIVVSEYLADGGTRTVRALPSHLDHPLWRKLRAVREGHVVAMPARVLLSTSHHVARAVPELRRALEAP